MPAMALARVGARGESGPGGEDLDAEAWQRLEALPDPRSPRGGCIFATFAVAIFITHLLRPFVSREGLI